MSISVAEFNALYAKPAKKQAKFKNVKVEYGGMTFDSRKECARWKELETWQRMNVITNLRRQVVFVLAPAVRLDGRMKPEMKYLADFCYIENGIEITEDVKSAITSKDPLYRAKRHLLKHIHNRDIREV